VRQLEVGPKLEPSWEFFIKQPLRGAAELRKHLSINEDTYLTTAPQAFPDARSYVIYTALDEVKKTSMHLMRLAELIDCPPFSPRSDRLDRLLVTQIIEEREARIRRLLEVLVMLILFEETNEQPYYRHLLLLERLRGMLSEKTDIEDFFDINNSNLDDSIAMEVQWIEEVERELDVSKCWYLYERKPVGKVKKLRGDHILSSMRKRIKTAVPLMNSREKLIFGLSYNAGYGRTSTAIHYRADRSDYLLEDGAEREMIGGVGLIAISTLVRCYQLMGRPEAPIVAKLEDVSEKAIPKSLFETIAELDVDVGDFVLAQGDLAEIVGTMESDFGYKSYRVRYLAERPKPHIHEDSFPAKHIKILYRRSQLIERMKRVPGGPKDFSKQIEGLSWDETQAILRESITEIWKAGLGRRVRR
jgi:hypothetical protein